MSLATSCLKRKVQFGDTEAFLEAPTVRQAVQILHFLTHLEDEADEDRLFELISELGWHGAIDAAFQLRLLFNGNRMLFASTLRTLLLQGYTPKESTSKGKSGLPDWSWFLHEYCRTYNAEPWQAYNMPFAFFMEMLSDANREKARRQLDRAFEVSAGFGSKELTKKWSKEAYPPKEKPFQEELSEEELRSDRKEFKKRLS